MHIGLQVPNYTMEGGVPALRSHLKNIAQFVDSHGFYSLWVMDHFFQLDMLGGADREMLESYSTLSYFAALTERVKLGALVTGVIYRHPGLLLKTVTTLDVLSGGRAYFGIGAAWYEREALGLGVPYPPTGERMERLEETLQLARRMFAGDRTPFHGKHYNLHEPFLNPMPIGTPKIMVGGQGEKKTLRFVAQYADACNFFLRNGEAALSEKLDVLKRHCDAVGRDYGTIEKTTLGTITATTSAGQVLDDCQMAARLGFTHVIYNVSQVENMAILEMLANSVIPEAAGM
jgi:F420-dependent oxidoreductase-like protein